MGNRVNTVRTLFYSIYKQIVNSFLFAVDIARPLQESHRTNKLKFFFFSHKKVSPTSFRTTLISHAHKHTRRRSDNTS